MRRFVPVLMMFLAAALPAAAQDALLREIAASCLNRSSIECSFTQTRHLPMMDDDIVSEGRLSYSRPDAIRWEYTSPERMLLEMKGTDIRVSRGEGADATDISANRMYRDLAGLLLGVVSGNFLMDDKWFSALARQDGNTITLQLLPQKRELKRMWTGMTMRFDSVSHNALRIEITEAGGGSTTIEFSNYKNQF